MIERDPLFQKSKEIFRTLGIEAVFYDLDDTLIYTSEIFFKYISMYSETIAHQTGLDSQEILQTISDIDFAEYQTQGVNPKRWESVVNKAGDLYPHLKHVFVSNLSILTKIYTDPPRIRPGAKILLEGIQEIGLKQGLVTHANSEWTRRKLDQLQLWNYFDSIHIADENGHKGPEDWKKCMDSVGVLPQNCLIVGDSLHGDILPCYDLGSRTMWIPGPWGSPSNYTIPPKTIQLSEISDVLPSLSKFI